MLPMLASAGMSALNGDGGAGGLTPFNGSSSATATSGGGDLTFKSGDFMTNNAGSNSPAILAGLAAFLVLVVMASRR